MSHVEPIIMNRDDMNGVSVVSSNLGFKKVNGIAKILVFECKLPDWMLLRMHNSVFDESISMTLEAI